MKTRNQITRSDLMSLEQYAEKRAELRSKVLKHKKYRQVSLGPNATLYFEDRLTLIYQIQEMLRIEKIFEAPGIEEELAAYNPMLPDGHNFKATFMIEYADAEVRAKQLAKMVGIEEKVWMQVGTFDKVWAMADEDLERTTDTKTSAVHFMRFEITDNMAIAIKNAADWFMGVQHPVYNHHTKIGDEIRANLINDLD